jgi:hypothetical protein
MEGLSLNFDLSFFITLGIILLVGAGIFYYCYTRLNVLEDSVINQGKILQTFLMNQQNNTLTPNNNTLSSNEKLDIPDDTILNSTNNDSYSEDSEEDSDSEEEREEREDSEEDSDSEDDEVKEDSNKNKDDKIKVADESVLNEIGIVNINSNLENATGLIFSQMLDVNSLVPKLEVEEPNITEIKNLDLDNKNIKVVDIENKHDDIEDETLDNEDTKKKQKSLNKMNAQELKDLVLQKGLATNDDITKLKKSELLEMLQNNK